MKKKLFTSINPSGKLTNMKILDVTNEFYFSDGSGKDNIPDYVKPLYISKPNTIPASLNIDITDDSMTISYIKINKTYYVTFKNGNVNDIDNGLLIFSEIPYTFKISKYSNDTFTIHDIDKKFSLYSSESLYASGGDYFFFMGITNNPSYFQIQNYNSGNIYTNIKDYCTQIIGPDYNSQSSFYKNNTFIRLSKDIEKCQTWCNDKKDECNPLKMEYCYGDNLLDPLCQNYCKENDCENALMNYCKDKNLDDEKYTELCGCFKGPNFYSNYFEGIRNKYPNFPTEYTVPSCSFPFCASSTFKPEKYKNVSCPNIVKCIQNIDINNSGEINNINIEQNAVCRGIFNNCNENEILINNVCSICPPGQEPSKDRTKCITKCGNNEYIIDNSCQTCPDEKIPSKDKTKCIECIGRKYLDYNDKCQDCPTNKFPSKDKRSCIDVDCNWNNQIVNNGECVTCGKGKIPSTDKIKCIIPSESKYSCNFLGKCELDINGKYSTIEDCKDSCGKRFILFIGSVIVVILLILLTILFIIKRKS